MYYGTGVEAALYTWQNLSWPLSLYKQFVEMELLDFFRLCHASSFTLVRLSGPRIQYGSIQHQEAPESHLSTFIHGECPEFGV